MHNPKQEILRRFSFFSCQLPAVHGNDIIMPPTIVIFPWARYNYYIILTDYSVLIYFPPPLTKKIKLKYSWPTRCETRHSSLPFQSIGFGSFSYLPPGLPNLWWTLLWYSKSFNTSWACLAGQTLFSCRGCGWKQEGKKQSCDLSQLSVFSAKMLAESMR